MFVNLKTSLGIEIRDNELLMVALKKSLKQWVVSGYRIISNHKQMSKPDLKREVQRFARNSGAAREQIVLGIPRERAVLRMIELPREVEENLSQVIQFQVENLTPAEDVIPYYDFTVLSRQGAHLQILLVMVKKEVLDEHLALIHELGVQPNSVQLSTVGLSNLALSRPNLPPDMVNLLFTVGEKKLEIVGIKHRQLWYSKHLNLPEEVPSGDLMASEIDTALSTMRLEDGQVEKIWFAGKDAEAILPSFRARVEDSDYLIKNFHTHVPKGLQPLLANDLASTIGLALGALTKKPPVNINLLPKEKRVHYNKLSFVPSVILALTVIGLALAPTVLRYRKDARTLEQLNAEIKKLEPQVNEIKRLKKENETLEKKVQVLEDLTKSVENPLDMLKDLTQRIPENTYLTSYRLQKNGDLTLTLSSTSSSSAVIKKLSESPYLKEVQLQSDYDQQGRRTLVVKVQLKKES